MVLFLWGFPSSIHSRRSLPPLPPRVVNSQRRRLTSVIYNLTRSLNFKRTREVETGVASKDTSKDLPTLEPSSDETFADLSVVWQKYTCLSFRRLSSSLHERRCWVVLINIVSPWLLQISVNNKNGCDSAGTWNKKRKSTRVRPNSVKTRRKLYWSERPHCKNKSHYT